MTDRGLQMPATPEHAAQYTTGEPKQDDFLFCWPRDAFERPNVALYHDTDLVATGGMKPGGRDMWAYACAATGLPFDRVEWRLGGRRGSLRQKRTWPTKNHQHHKRTSSSKGTCRLIAYGISSVNQGRINRSTHSA
uniref:DNA encoding 14.5 kDa and 6 kDa proteins n=1 Tax=Salmonella typhimurium TaxID=90371 RepID=Q56081_SALTM|nr:unnamed protein product [Salmonella enterica subsp. enterica serovar Typhimurium]